MRSHSLVVDDVPESETFVGTSLISRFADPTRFFGERCS